MKKAIITIFRAFWINGFIDFLEDDAHSSRPNPRLYSDDGIHYTGYTITNFESE